MYTPEGYETLIKGTSVGKIDSIILNFDKQWPQYFRKYEISNETMTIKNKNDRKIYPVISEIRVNYFEMDKENFTGSLHINGMIQSMFRVNKPNVIPITFPNEGTFENENTINEKNKIK